MFLKTGGALHGKNVNVISNRPTKTIHFSVVVYVRSLGVRVDSIMRPSVPIRNLMNCEKDTRWGVLRITNIIKHTAVFQQSVVKSWNEFDFLKGVKYF